MTLFSYTSRAKPQTDANDGIYTCQGCFPLRFPAGGFPFTRSTYCLAYRSGTGNYFYLEDQTTVFRSNRGTDRVIKKILQRTGVEQLLITCTLCTYKHPKTTRIINSGTTNLFINIQRGWRHTPNHLLAALLPAVCFRSIILSTMSRRKHHQAKRIWEIRNGFVN
jgi:hypothetical protein